MSASAAALTRRTRLTYLLFFRVVVISLLLGARLLEEFTAPLGAPSLGLTPGLILTVVAYASAIGLSLWLRYASDAQVDRVAIAQVVFDLFGATVLIHLTGGIESQLAFTYLIIVAGAGLLFPRGALRAAVAAVVLFATLVASRRLGLISSLAQVTALPTRELTRAALLNGVAILTTGALASRLAVELARTGASLDQKSAQLADLATLYADVVRSLSSGLLTLDVDGRVATANQAALTILHLREEELVGRWLRDSVPALGALLDTPREVRRQDLSYRDRADVPRCLGVTVSPLVDSGDRAIGQIVVFQDLTELRKMEEAVIRQQRLAAVGRLAAGVAHEIRNPLAAISGSIELLVATGGHDASSETKELASIVQRETVRLNGLITDLLEFARPRPLDLLPIDLGEAISELVQVFRNDPRLGSTRIELSSQDGVRIEADPGQLRQVMWNLLRNAAEAAPDLVIRVRVAREPNTAVLIVEDEGPGIPEDQLSRVFEPFFTTKERGTGLGLPTVHRIIEEHRGTIELSRNDAGGLTATVRLPSAA